MYFYGKRSSVYLISFTILTFLSHITNTLSLPLPPPPLSLSLSLSLSLTVKGVGVSLEKRYTLIPSLTNTLVTRRLNLVKRERDKKKLILSKHILKGKHYNSSIHVYILMKPYTTAITILRRSFHCYYLSLIKTLTQLQYTYT